MRGMATAAQRTEALITFVTIRRRREKRHFARRTPEKPSDRAFQSRR